MHKLDIVGILQAYAWRVTGATSEKEIIKILKDLRKEFDLKKLKKIEGVKVGR